MAIGDSQALGYGIPYEATFTALYAARTNREAVLVAAPADDPDYERLAAMHYVAATGTIPDTVFVVVNFGNDVDELFLGRENLEGRESGSSSWLPEHSFVYGDLALAARILARRFIPDKSLPPGTNPVAYALDRTELPVVSEELARDVVAIVRETNARAAVAVLIPPDYVVDPAEFEKYRKYYTAREYSVWRARLPFMSAVMTSLEQGLEIQLRARGIRVLDARDMLAHISARLAFDRYSHHLTPLANRAIAGRIP